MYLWNWAANHPADSSHPCLSAASKQPPGLGGRNGGTTFIIISRRGVACIQTVHAAADFPAGCSKMFCCNKAEATTLHLVVDFRFSFPTQSPCWFIRAAKPEVSSQYHEEVGVELQTERRLWTDRLIGCYQYIQLGVGDERRGKEQAERDTHARGHARKKRVTAGVAHLHAILTGNAWVRIAFINL